METQRVLIVDDNVVDREHIRRLLGAQFSVFEAETAREGLSIVEREPIDCILLDYRLPDIDGINALGEFTRRRLPVLMLTAQGNENIAVEAMKRGALDYLSKSQLGRDQLRRSVDHAIERARLELRVAEQQRKLESYVAELSSRRAALEASNRALLEREAQLRVIMQQLPAVAWTLDTELRITSALGKAWPPESESPLGGSALPNTALAEALRQPEAAAAHRAALSGESARYQIDSQQRTYECHVEPLHAAGGGVAGVIGVGLDVTEIKALEQQLRQAQKMEAVGQLAGGIAHDFNNILTAILSFSGFVKETLQPGERSYEDIEEVLRAAARAQRLVRQLLTFSRRRSVRTRVVDVNSVVRETLPMLLRLLGEDVELDFEPVNDPFHVRIDPAELEQVLINLAVNARDAMPQGGRVTIRTENTLLDRQLSAVRGASLAPGEYLKLSLSDQGTGIAPDLLDKIFDPFFTTKDAGRGTGLGLSTCYGIITQAGGTLSVHSELGRGTTFHAYLPRVSEPVEHPVTARAPESPRGRETVLVVEDEAPVRAVVVRILRRLGYKVLEAAGGRAALELARDYDGDVDLVLTDVIMPELSGTAVAKALKGRFPHARILYMSGYSDTAMRHRGTLGDDVAVIEKPLTAEALALKVRTLLDLPRADPAPGS